MASRCRRGLTLLEVIVVIAILAILIVVAAPGLIFPTAKSTGDLAAVLESAKRAAVLRGEPVTLTVDDAGAWTITGDANPTAAAIATGALEPAPGRARVRVSALGACIPENVPAASRDWSAVGCGPRQVEAPQP